MLLASQNLHLFERTQKIGEGTYGVVYKAYDRINCRVVALKIIKTDDNQGISSTTLREVSMLRLLSHENIITLHYIIPHETFFCFVFEYLDQDLKAYMDSVRAIPKPIIKSFTRQLLLALQYCHSNCVMHRDLKPQNLLIDRQRGTLKLCDFGLARYHAINSLLHSSIYTHEVVTLWYRPPELLLGMEEYSTQTDLWGVGCIFSEMITKIPLFPGDSEIDQLNKIFNVLGTPTERVWPGCTSLKGWKGCSPQFKSFRARSLIDKLGVNICDVLEAELMSCFLLYDPLTRISACDALQHQYFQEV